VILWECPRRCLELVGWIYLATAGHQAKRRGVRAISMEARPEDQRHATLPDHLVVRCEVWV
jgi:hypothetical protein